MTLTTERSSRRRLIAVHVPIVTASDPQWYRTAAHAAGFTAADCYRVRSEGFLTRGAGNQKIGKSDSESTQYLSAILHLAPHSMSGKNVCAAAHGCRHVCVTYNGKGQMSNEGFAPDNWLVANVSIALRHNVHAARIAKTRLLRHAPELFAELLEADILRFSRSAAKQGLIPAIRPNGTSDLPWTLMRFERFGNRSIFDTFSGVQFYDYTKIRTRALAAAQGRLPENYDITFSRDETNHDACNMVLASGGRVAVVVQTDAMRTSWGAPLAKLGKEATAQAIEHGIPGFDPKYPRVNADATDLRFLDPTPALSVLYAKGRAARDDSGFSITL